MPDYEKLYFQLFNSITDVIEKLIKIQQESEEKYLNSCNKNDFKLIQVCSDN